MKNMEYTYQLFGLPVLCWAFIVLAIALIMFMPSGKNKNETAGEALQKKFADSILSLAEYEERKAVLAKDLQAKKSNWFRFSEAGFPASDFYHPVVDSGIVIAAKI